MCTETTTECHSKLSSSLTSEGLRRVPCFSAAAATAPSRHVFATAAAAAKFCVPELLHSTTFTSTTLLHLASPPPLLEKVGSHVLQVPFILHLSSTTGIDTLHAAYQLVYNSWTIPSVRLSRDGVDFAYATPN